MKQWRYLKDLSNDGPHVSMYVKDLPSTYKRADALGLAYVNPTVDSNTAPTLWMKPFAIACFWCKKIVSEFE
jgi:hypothetical protein